MKRVLLFFLLFSLCSTTAAFAENVWMDEGWQQVYREMDCDGLPMIVNARVLKVPEGTTAREYHTKRLSDEFMVEKGQKIDWSLLNCNTSQGKWRYPTSMWPEYQFNGDDIYPLCSISALCSMLVNTRNSDYLTRMSGTYPDETDMSPIGNLTEEQVNAYAEQVAAACGCQLGKPIRVFRGDQVEDVRKNIEACIRQTGTHYNPNPAEAEEYRFFDVWYPVYFQGLRLYSGEYISTAEGIEIPNMNMRLGVTTGHGLILAQCVVFDPFTFVAEGPAQHILSVEDAIECFREKYANMFLPGVRQITVSQIAMEYVAMTGDVSATKGYTLYPAWVAQYTMEMDDGDAVSSYEAYHAVTGRPLF